MGLEALTPTTYINGLTEAWPTTGEPKAQGDDHLRLIKGVLKNTFPNATKPFRFPTSSVITTTTPLTESMGGSTIFFDTGTGFTVSLPILGLGDAGWEIKIIKHTSDANLCNVVPSSGSILSAGGLMSRILIGAVCSPATFIWSGVSWICHKAGAMIGATMNWDGATAPPGWFAMQGQTLDPVAFCELVGALGGMTVLPDKRGRIEAAVDAGAGRLSSNTIAGGPLLGHAGGVEAIQLTEDMLPSHRHRVVIYDPTHRHHYNEAYNVSGTTRRQDFQVEVAYRDVLTSAEATGVRTTAG